MPVIDSKVSIKMTKDQETKIKERLGKVISLVPGKSENWLMVGFQDDYHLYFRGQDSEPMAFVEVKLFGGSDKAAFRELTKEITAVFGDVLGIAPDHMYIRYLPSTDWGWNGGNF